MPSLTAAEQRELQTRMEKKQMKEFMNVRIPRHFPILNGKALFHFAPCSPLPPDVFQPRPVLLRSLRQRLREQVPYLARGELCHEMRRQAHEGFPASGRQVPRAKCCHGTGWSARQVKQV